MTDKNSPEKKLEEILGSIKVVDRRMSDVDILLKKGSNLLNTNKYAAARKHFQEILEIDSENAEANHMLGISYLKSQKRKEGWEYLTRAVELNPKNRKHCEGLEEVLVVAKKPEEVVLLAERLSGLDTLDGYKINNLVVESLVRYSKYSEALPVARKLLDSDPVTARANKRLVNILINIGKTEFDNNKYTSSRRLFGEALEIESDNSELNYLMGMSFLSSRDKKNAIKYLIKAVDLDIGNLKYHKDLVDSIYTSRDKNYDKIIESCKIILKDSENDIHFNEILAESYFKLEDYENSSLTYRTLSKLKPKDENYRTSVIKSLINESDFEGTLDYIREVRMLDFNFSLYEREYFDSLVELKEYEKAVDTAKSLYNKRQGSSELNYNLGFVLSKIGKTEEAIPYLHSAACSYGAGRVVEYKEYLDEVLKSREIPAEEKGNEVIPKVAINPTNTSYSQNTNYNKKKTGFMEFLNRLFS